MNGITRMAAGAIAAGISLAGTADELRLSFDGEGDPSPVRCEKVDFVRGLSGKAVHVGRDSFLEYSAGIPGFMTATSGTFMAWFRQDKTMPSGDMYRDRDRADNGNIQWIVHSGSGIRTLFASNPSMSYVGAGLCLVGCMGNSGSEKYWSKRIQGGEWHFVAVTYDIQSDASLWYADGIVVRSNALAGVKIPFSKTFTLGCGRERPGLEGAIDEVRFMPVALDEEALRNEYLKWQPIRYELHDWSVGEGETKKFRFRARNESAAKVEKKIKFSNGAVVSLSLEPNELKDFTVEVNGVKPGLFKLFLNEGEPDARQFECICLAKAETAAPTGKKRLLGEYDCTKPYPSDRVALCASEVVATNGLAYLESRDYRTAVPLAAYRFKIQHQGRPHIVELDYPDDRPRTFLFGVYPEKWTRLNTITLDCAGIMTGIDYPLSFGMQTKRLVFWPDSETVTIVVQNFSNKNGWRCRPMRKGESGMYPAACAAVRLYEVDGLPPGPVQGMSPKARSIAEWDEDPTMDSSLAFARAFNFYNCDLEFWRIKWQRIIDYMRWNSMDSWVVKVTSYNGDVTAMDATIPEAALPWTSHLTTAGRCRGWAELGADMMSRAGMGFWVRINHRNHDSLGWFAKLGGGECGDGICFGSRDGKFSRFKPNFLNPVVRKAYLRLVAAYRDKFSAYPGFRGLTMNEALPVYFGGIDFGYDDTTIGCFERDTGIKVPAIGMKERYDWLVGDGERRAKWIKWRCEATAQFARELSETLRSNGGDAEVQIWIAAAHYCKNGSAAWKDWDADRMFQEAGVDMAQLAKIPGVRPVPCVRPDYYRAHNLILAAATDEPYLPDSPSWTELVRQGGIDAVNVFRHSNLEIFPTMGSWESGVTPFKTELWMPTYNIVSFEKDFQSYSTPHAAPPYTLDSVASLVADADVQDFLTGWWGIMESGEHDEWRRFYGQFRQIPRGRYALAKGPDDPVAVRSGTEGHYLVNREPYPVKVEYVVDGKTEKLILRHHEIRFVEGRGANGNVEVVKLTIPTEEKAKHLANLEKLEAGAKAAPKDATLARAAKEARAAFEAGCIHQFRALFHLGEVRKFMHPEILIK